MNAIFKSKSTRLLSAFLAVLMVVAMLPVTAFAWTAEEGTKCTSTYGDLYLGSDGNNYYSKAGNRILEDNNSTRMICNRVKDHLHQRMDVYWNAALRKHPDNARMPVIPCVEVKSRAEAVYLEPHMLLMQRAESLSQTLSDDEKEAA